MIIRNFNFNILLLLLYNFYQLNIIMADKEFLFKDYNQNKDSKAKDYKNENQLNKIKNINESLNKTRTMMETEMQLLNSVSHNVHGQS